MELQKKLGEAVYKLMQDRTFNQITLEEIVTEAGVTVAEFRKVFKTKHDVVEWEYLHLLSAEARDILGSSCWSEALFKKFTFYEKHLKFYQNVCRSSHMGHLRLANQRFVRDAYYMMLKHSEADRTDPHIKFAIDMAVYGGEEMTWQWVAQGMKEPKEVMLVLFQESIPKCICQYFR